MSGKPRLAFARFASCSGCQLSLLNCEDSLPLLDRLVAIADFPLLATPVDSDGSIDVALAEGSITSPAQCTALLDLRRRSTWLVAVGACAVNGGINRLATPRDALFPLVYGTAADHEHPPLPLATLVKVDAVVPGCPPEGDAIIGAVATLLRGAPPLVPDYPVCMECRSREIRCLLHQERRPCLGPVTRAGCDARCPAIGVGCEGCRGPAPEANTTELADLLRATGMTHGAVAAALRRFGGDA